MSGGYVSYRVCVQGVSVQGVKPIFHWKWGSRWVPNANEIYTKKHEMYMANASILRWDPTQLYSTDWRCGLALGKTQVLALGNAKIYQHVGIASAKFWRRGHCPTPTPDARYFTSQWNIGLSVWGYNYVFWVNVPEGLSCHRYGITDKVKTVRFLTHVN